MKQIFSMPRTRIIWNSETASRTYTGGAFIYEGEKISKSMKTRTVLRRDSKCYVRRMCYWGFSFRQVQMSGINIYLSNQRFLESPA
jgi:hypothetical protein